MSEPVLVESVEQLLNLLSARSELATTEMPSRAGKPYCPSSGTEGFAFEEAWCGSCVFYRNDDEDAWGCPILEQAHIVADAADPAFPNQWAHDEHGAPSCRAYTEGTARLAGGALTPTQERELYEKARRGEL